MKIFRITIVLMMASALMLSASCGQTDKEIPGDLTDNESPAPTENTADFNFVLRYGIMNGNKLDTFNGKYTKDMILDPDITIDLKLTTDELAQILAKMKEIDFFNYPDAFIVEVPPGELRMFVTPCDSYYFKVEYGSVTKELRWQDEIRNENEKADRLRELIEFITDIIESKEEYKRLPEPRGGYL